MFGYNKDLYVCTVYNNPYSSGSNNCAFLQLQKDIERFSNLGEILLCGDFNARTASLDDFVNSDYISTHIHTGEGYSMDKPVHNIRRQNKDVKTNTWGKELLNLCKGANLRILNGRTMGDLYGDFTYYKNKARSAVDYVIVGKTFLDKISHFKVSEPIVYLSDHCYLETVLKCKLNLEAVPKKTSKTKKLYSRFIWKAESSEKFVEV